MKITGTTPLRSTPSRRKDAVGKSTPGAFGAEMKGAGGTGSAAGARPVETVDALLVAQEVPDAVASARRGQRRAGDLLDRLEELRDALLTGRVPRHRLDELVRLVRGRREHVADPRLAEILDEIELRCRVEIAKLARLGDR